MSRIKRAINHHHPESFCSRQAFVSASTPNCTLPVCRIVLYLGTMAPQKDGTYKVVCRHCKRTLHTCPGLEISGATACAWAQGWYRTRSSGKKNWSCVACAAQYWTQEEADKQEGDCVHKPALPPTRPPTTATSETAASSVTDVPKPPSPQKARPMSPLHVRLRDVQEQLTNAQDQLKGLAALVDALAHQVASIQGEVGEDNED